MKAGIHYAGTPDSKQAGFASSQEPR